MNQPDYDSHAETTKHIRRVRELIADCIRELARRAEVHDQSKLHPPEKPLFDKFTPRLRSVSYGSKEYKRLLDELAPALDHHYAHNSHHPQHYQGGVNGMDLFDLVEMFMDWKAASERHADGDIRRSIETNRSRFDLSDQLCDIMHNTATNMGW